MARPSQEADGRPPPRRGARLALGGLLIVAGIPSTALAETDVSHGDVDLPALTPEEAKQLGLENAPDDQDQAAPGSGAENATDLPDNQGAGAPDPEESAADGDGGPDEPGYSGPPASAPPPASPSPSGPQLPPPAQATPPPSLPAPSPPSAGPQAVAPSVQPPAPRPPKPRVGSTPSREQPSIRPDTAPRTGTPRRPSPRQRGALAVPPHHPAGVVVTPAAKSVPRPIAAAATADPRAAGEAVVVRAGDSLWSIARRTLGGSASAAEIAAFVDRLWELNKHRIRSGTPDLIAVGERLRIPGGS